MTTTATCTKTELSSNSNGFLESVVPTPTPIEIPLSYKLLGKKSTPTTMTSDTPPPNRTEQPHQRPSYDSSPFTISNVSAVDLQKATHGLNTGVGFFDHMLDQFNSHAQIGVSVQVTKQHDEPEPNTDDDASHRLTNRHADPPELQEQLMGQVGHALGLEFHKLLSPLPPHTQSRFRCPLDEALVECHITLATTTTVDDDEPTPPGLHAFTLPPYGIYPSTGRTMIGRMSTAYVRTFFDEFAAAAGIHLSLRKIRGDNGHHIVESAFKALSRALRNGIDGTNTVDVPGSVAHGEAMEGMWGRGSEGYRQGLEMGRVGASMRKTKETSIDVDLRLDGGEGGVVVETGIETLDRFYRALAEEAGLSLDVRCRGDTWVDDHHTAEDVSIAIGKVLNTALGTKAGLNRMWCATAKVGDAQVLTTMDLSNRPCFNHGLSLDGEEYIGDMSMEMLHHILESLVMNGQMTVHVDEVSKGGSVMDLALAIAKSFGRALKFCSAVDPRRAGKIASSKGTLSV